MTALTLVLATSTTPERILSLLKSVDDQFFVPLSRRVSLEAYAEKLAARAIHYFAVADGIDVGHVAFYIAPEDRAAFISNIAVRRAYRRKGVGKSLMNSTLEYCRALSIQHVSLEVHAHAADAIDFYRRQGFYAVADDPRAEHIQMFSDLR